MQARQNIPLSRFPADLISLILLPATMVVYVAASYLSRLWRATLFGLVGLAFVVAAIRLARSGHVLRFVWAAIYLLMGFAVFYIAYVEATLFV